MSDVRISNHYAKVNKANFIVIRFADDLHNLIGTDYVILNIVADRLYFAPSEIKVTHSLKLNKMVSSQRQYKDLIPFIGEYSLEYDNVKNMYYIDKSKKSELSRTYSNSNVAHPNYKSHANEPYVSEIEANSENIITTVDMSIKSNSFGVDGLFGAVLTVLYKELESKKWRDSLKTLECIKILVEKEYENE